MEHHSGCVVRDTKRDQDCTCRCQHGVIIRTPKSCRDCQRSEMEQVDGE